MIHGGVGAINESDVSLASASNAIIIGFNVRPDATGKIQLQSVRRLRCTSVQRYLSGNRRCRSCYEGYAGSCIYEEKVIGHAAGPSDLQGIRCWYTLPVPM